MTDPADFEAITRLVYEYGYGIDQRDWAGYRSIFADDITMDFSSYSGDGGPEHLTADAWVERVRPLFDGLDATQHSMSNPLVDVAEGGRAARCRMYMQAAHFLVDDPDPEFTIGGFYDDHLERNDGMWRITAVTLTVWWRRGNPEIMVAARQRGR
ncbi:MAG: nuclear transport factor 2 family protein [Actinomycetota bacterium]